MMRRLNTVWSEIPRGRCAGGGWVLLLAVWLAGAVGACRMSWAQSPEERVDVGAGVGVSGMNPGTVPGEGRGAVRAVVAFPNLKFDRPLYLTHGRDGTDRLYVVEQAGRVLWFENQKDVAEAHVALDIRKRVRREGEEEGLLGLAFHPQFKTNRKVYVFYSAAGGKRRNVLSCFEADENGQSFKPDSEKEILSVEQPWSNHNGGMIEFGPDGYLYIGLGDGGAAADPYNNAQDKSTFLGKILRIDVDRAGEGLAYAIPPDNPFVGEKNVQGEIWAYGLRNPWRFSFDRKTGLLWAGDVGQDRWEEIDLIKKGGNYGWSEWEGFHLFKEVGRRGPFEKPVVEHGHGEARCITGGYVYRGKRNPSLVGMYIYGDFLTGLVWGFRYDGKRVMEHRYLTRVPGPASFGEDRDGELYVTSFDGRIYTFTVE